MPKLAFSRRELRDASAALSSSFRAGWGAVGTRVARGALLAGLYAVECGLKAVLLDRRGLHTTAGLAADDKAFTHDLDWLLNELGQPRQFGTARREETRRGAHERPGDPIRPDRYHEVYRYGGRLVRRDEERLVAVVASVLQFIEENSK